MSTSRVFRSAEARLAARLTAVVVLPTPPFWLEMQIVRDKVLTPKYRRQEQAQNGPLWRGWQQTLRPSRSVPRGTSAHFAIAVRWNTAIARAAWEKGST